MSKTAAAAATEKDKDKDKEKETTMLLPPSLLPNIQFDRTKHLVTIATRKGPATFQLAAPLLPPLLHSGPPGNAFKHYLVLTPTNFILYVEPAHPNWLYMWDINESKAGRLAFAADLVGIQSIPTSNDHLILISTAFSMKIITLSEMLLLYRKEPKFASSVLSEQMKLQLATLTHSELKKPLMAVAKSQHSGYVLVATLGEKIGDVAIISTSGKPNTKLEQVVIKQAHLEDISALQLSTDGHYLATASQRGTMIRVWDTTSGKKTHEFRRGRRGAEVQSMSFSPDSKWLAVASDHRTVHLFAIELQSANKGSSYLMAAMTLSTSTMFAAATYNFAEYIGFEGLTIHVHMDNARVYVYFPQVHALHILEFDAKNPNELKEFPWWKEKAYSNVDADFKRPEKDPFLDFTSCFPPLASSTTAPAPSTTTSAASSVSTVVSNASTITTVATPSVAATVAATGTATNYN